MGATHAPVTGYALTVYDGTMASAPRADVSATTAADGSFRACLTSFPTSEPDRTAPHAEILQITAANYLTAYRKVYLHPGTAFDVALITLVPPDPNITMIGPAGGTAVDSQGLIEVDIPAGALSTATPRA